MNEPRIIRVGEEPPPLEPAAAVARQASHEPKRARRGDTAGRFAVLNGFVDAGMAGLSRAEALTWLVLYRDTRNGTARTSAVDVARRIGISKRAVLTAIGRLCGRGLLTRVYRGGMNRGVSIYRVHPLPREPTHG